MYGEIDFFDDSFDQFEHDGSVLWYMSSEEDYEIAKFYEEKLNQLVGEE